MKEKHQVKKYLKIKTIHKIRKGKPTFRSKGKSITVLGQVSKRNVFCLMEIEAGGTCDGRNNLLSEYTTCGLLFHLFYYARFQYEELYMMALQSKTI